MNRPIEFRAWDKLHKEWLGADAWFVRTDSAVLVVWPEVAKGMDISVHMETLDSSRVDLSQFTGLRDKNGVEIYEGDIVRTDYNFGSGFTVEPLYVGEIKYLIAEFVLFNAPIAEPLTGLARNRWKLEVIGNVYETPELLEAQS